MSRPTPSEVVWPMDADSHQQAQEWASDATKQVLDWTWLGFDAMKASLLSRVDFSQPLDQVERDLTSHHFREIQQLWASETEGYAAFAPQPEWPEMATRSPAPAKPPAYDIAFVWNDNPRVAWPIEAKVVPTSGTLAPYLGDTTKFISGTAAPFIGEGAQIAYLLNGTADDFFNNLSLQLPPPLQTFVDFSARSHRISSHSRTNVPNLRLHHMAMMTA
jgi:hypothetical protein